MLNVSMEVSSVMERIAFSLTADGIIEASEATVGDENVNVVIRELAKQFGEPEPGSAPLEEVDPDEEIETFYRKLIDFMKEAKIEDVVHFYLRGDRKMTIVLIVSSNARVMIQNWYQSLIGRNKN